MSNCGLGFAPVRAEDRDLLIEFMEGVEDIPAAVLRDGLDWEWSSFAEYLDALGFSTSRTLNHRTLAGEPIPSLGATGDELAGIAMGLRDAGQGVL